MKDNQTTDLVRFPSPLADIGDHYDLTHALLEGTFKFHGVAAAFDLSSGVEETRHGASALQIHKQRYLSVGF